MDNSGVLDLKRFKVNMLNGHLVIEDHLGFINVKNVNSAELRESLKVLEGYIYGHLSRQSDQIYDHLKEMVSDNRADLKMIEFLIFDLKQIKVSTLIFFNSTPRNFKVYFNDIKNRINIEKLYFLPLIK